MIELVGLDKSYGGRRILSDAALTVNGGESVALVGANGSGKTTTLRCAVGLARPDRGHIRIDGVDLWDRQREARSRVSYLAQRTDFPSTLTVREILRVVAELRHAPAQSVERELSLCGLQRVAARIAGALSGGERQRVAMAALLIPDVSAYLLDEPTLNLDPIGSRMLVDRLRALRDAGRAVLFTTHVNGQLEALATRVVMLRDAQFVPAVDDLCPGKRHMSLTVGDGAEALAATALQGGATRAWAQHGTLHAIVSDASVSRMLERLGNAGASVSTFRTETALARALDLLNHDEPEHAHAPAGRVDRSTAVGELWRHFRWAGADSAGPR
jgi:ABC-type multidrug transport system ATPase subunit